jgi:ketosteroid isomerase-like protein
VHHNGEQNDRKKMLDDIGSGALKYAKLTTYKITVTVAGDTAIVRGTSDRQREGQNPFTTFYTLVFTYRGGAWKAISLHTSRNV